MQMANFLGPHTCVGPGSGQAPPRMVEGGRPPLPPEAVRHHRRPLKSREQRRTSRARRRSCRTSTRTSRTRTRTLRTGQCRGLAADGEEHILVPHRNRNRRVRNRSRFLRNRRSQKIYRLGEGIKVEPTTSEEDRAEARGGGQATFRHRRLRRPRPRSQIPTASPQVLAGRL